MIDAAMAGNRIIGMIQPDEIAPETPHGSALCTIGCAGRVTSFAETGDDRYIITLTGISRFRIVEEIQAPVPFRQCRVTAVPYQVDFRHCEDLVDRPSVLRTFRAYLDAHNLETDWESVDSASNETLINALAMMAPFGCAEKQALLEAPDLRSRAETLVAITEMSLAREAGRSGSLQ
jgi:Lon protease-like protein